MGIYRTRIPITIRAEIDTSAIVGSHLTASADTLANVIATGSSNTSANTSGAISVAHGLATSPTVAFAFPIGVASNIGVKHVDLKAIDATNVSFLTMSHDTGTAAVFPGSSYSVNFVWQATL